MATIMDKVTFIATAKFGLEMLVKQELQALGYENLRITNGRIELDATIADIPKLNIWLRCADRVQLKMAQFKAKDFDTLFENTKAIAWEDWITVDGKFTVNATTVKSQIKSDRSTQSIVKKAVVERLKEAYNVDWFAETGPEFTIQATIHKDVVTLMIDTSGAGLHKRGYRAEAGEAPLKETLAAAMVMLSFWNKERLLIDPMCGSGTILIEAAMIARNIPPGLDRTFAAEDWPSVPEDLWDEARRNGRSTINLDGKLNLVGYDINEKVLQIAAQNADKAGVGEDITFQQKDVKKMWIDQQYGILISNPPYGRRMAEFQDINQIYIALNKTFRKKSGWSIYILTADNQFPKYFKRSRPDRIRKLYNGNIQVSYYQYYGEKPE